MKMLNKNCCKHIFEIEREASANINIGHGGVIDIAVSKCNKCGLRLETSNAILYDAYQDQAEATKILAITTIISFITLILIVVGFYFDYMRN